MTVPLLRRALRPAILGATTLCVTAGVAAAQAVPSPALLVLNKSEATLSIVDPASGKTVGQVKTGDGPHEMVVSDDGRTAFVSNYGGGQAPGSSLSVIDLVARTEKRVDLAPLTRPHGVHLAEGKVYFSAEANRAVGSRP